MKETIPTDEKDAMEDTRRQAIEMVEYGKRERSYTSTDREKRGDLHIHAGCSNVLHQIFMIRSRFLRSNHLRSLIILCHDVRINYFKQLI
jgi:hypothetical protein